MFDRAVIWQRNVFLRRWNVEAPHVNEEHSIIPDDVNEHCPEHPPGINQRKTTMHTRTKSNSTFHRQTVLHNFILPHKKLQR